MWQPAHVGPSVNAADLAEHRPVLSIANRARVARRDRLGLLYILWREVRKIPAKLFTLMATAFVDMVGLLMIIPLLPFYVKALGGSGIDVLGIHFGIGTILGFIVAAFTVAQLVSAPMWGRFSDRVGRRPVPDCLSASASRI